MKRETITWGYCRISTIHQSLQRQEYNILQAFPEAIIVKEIFTGAIIRRDELDKIIKQCLPGDRIVFDEVSRLSRNSEEGFREWKNLYDRGIDLVFLKQQHINTNVYRDVIKNTIPLLGDDIDLILEGVNKYLMRLAEKQIKLAFEQAEKELELLHKRTSDGMLMAKLAGKQIGRPGGKTYTTKKSRNVKAIILKHNKTFGKGSLNDKETIALANINANTFYKYKREMLCEINENNKLVEENLKC